MQQQHSLQDATTTVVTIPLSSSTKVESLWGPAGASLSVRMLLQVASSDGVACLTDTSIQLPVLFAVAAAAASQPFFIHHTYLPSQLLTSWTAVSTSSPGSSLKLMPTDAVCGSTLSAVPACRCVTTPVVRTCDDSGACIEGSAQVQNQCVSVWR